MRRLGVRLLMVIVGITMLVVYGSGAVLAYLVLRWAWLGRPDLATTLVILVGLTLLFGYLSYQFGTARLLVANVEIPNAFALGSPGDGFVVIDYRLFRLLDDDELETILGHELAHLESHDGLVQTLAYTAVEMVISMVTVALLPVVLLLTGLSRSIAWIRGRPLEVGLVGWLRHGVAGVVGLLFLSLLLVVRAHSRRREFADDDRAVELTGQPAALARALRKIERASEPRGLLAQLFVHGDEEGVLTRWLSTHPSMDERIDRLASRQTVRGNRRRSPGAGTRIEVR